MTSGYAWPSRTGLSVVAAARLGWSVTIETIPRWYRELIARKYN
jgi:hypothetical protein